jgi:hypothetical protein
MTPIIDKRSNRTGYSRLDRADASAFGMPASVTHDPTTVAAVNDDYNTAGARIGIDFGPALTLRPESPIASG